MAEKAKRVLVVEDDPDASRVVRQCLSGPQVSLAQVTRLSDALERLAKERFDAVVTDLSLPDSRGPETFLKIKDTFPDLAVVVLTGSYGEDLGLQAVQQGAQDYLVKSEHDLRLLRRALLYAIERQRLHKDLWDLAIRDPLTGLYNRRGLAFLAEHQLTVARRESMVLAAMSVDVDGFKQINDAHGHDEGDRALVRVAGVLRRTFRAPDLLARLGGDEFVVIATTSNPEAISPVAARLRAYLKAANRAESSPYDLSVSVGVATLVPGEATTVNEVLLAADRAMYREKRIRKGEELLEENGLPPDGPRAPAGRKTGQRRKLAT